MVERRLVLVTGSGPGAGKSTLCRAVADALSARGAPSRCLDEDALLGPRFFGRFDELLGANDSAAIDNWADGARQVAVEATASGETWVLDALLPGFFWLLGRYPLARVEAARDDLAGWLRPLDPLVVYLAGDVGHVTERAVAVRGAAFRDRWVAAVGRWHVPEYHGAPVRSIDDLVRFTTWLDDGQRALLEKWRGLVLRLDAFGRVDEHVRAATDAIIAPP